MVADAMPDPLGMGGEAAPAPPPFPWQRIEKQR